MFLFQLFLRVMINWKLQLSLVGWPNVKKMKKDIKKWRNEEMKKRNKKWWLMESVRNWVRCPSEIEREEKILFMKVFSFHFIQRLKWEIILFLSFPGLKGRKSKCQKSKTIYFENWWKTKNLTSHTSFSTFYFSTFHASRFHSVIKMKNYLGCKFCLLMPTTLNDLKCS